MPPLPAPLPPRPLLALRPWDASRPLLILLPMESSLPLLTLLPLSKNPSPFHVPLELLALGLLELLALLELLKFMFLDII